MRLENRVSIVTGAGRNIGEGIAHAFAEEGAYVAVVDWLEERAQSVADAINAQRDGAAMALTCDVTKSDAVEGMTRAVIERWGRVDVLVNNVGVVDRVNVLELPEEEWERVIGVSLKSQFLCTKYAAKHMVERGGGGRIICIASTSGHRGRDGAVAYPAAKGGVLNMTRAFAVQLAPYDIRVNSVTPSSVLTIAEPGAPERIRTPNNLIGRSTTPRDVALACVFLASDDADAITGIDLPVDGGALAGSAPPRAR